MSDQYEFKQTQKKEYEKVTQKSAYYDKERKRKQQKKGVQNNAKSKKQQAAQNKKEESLREVLGFFINKIDESKYEKKKPKQKKLEMFRQMEGEEQLKDEIVQDEFLNKNEFAEIKGNYDDYGLGDLVLIFPNPDFEVANKSVSFKDAEKIFDEVLTVMTDEGVSKSQMQKERNSFLYAYLTLNPYVQDKVDDKKKMKKKKNDESEEQNEKEREKEKEKEKVENEWKDKDKNKEKNSWEKYQDYLKMIEKNKEELKLREEKQKLFDKQQEKGGFEQNYMEDINNKQDSNLNPTFSDPIKELLKVQVQDASQFRDVKKAWSKGGFLEKKVYEDQNDYDWVCSNGQPKDFLTLVRFTIMAKLCRNANLHTRSFISGDGHHIFMVIKSNRSVIMRQAESMKITKQLELGYADLFSLEPCDESFRPLRLKNYVKDYTTDKEVKNRIDQMKEYEEELKQDRKDRDLKDKSQPDRAQPERFMPNDGLDPSQGIEQRAKIIYSRIIKMNDLELRATIIKKQEEVDKYMKQIAKDLNFDMSHEKVELIDDKDITKQEWESYFIYLEYIIDFMKKMENLIKQYPVIKQNQAFLYKLIFRKAVGDANDIYNENHHNFWNTLRGKDAILYTLWDRLEVPPIAPYADFFIPNSESGASMWRKYEINEKGLRSEFINMEKIKITHAIILKNINVLKLIQQGMATAYFPIHDPYQLKGLSKEPFFKALYDASLMNETITTPGDKELKKLFLDMADEAESTDFDAESLEDEAQFNFKLPWFIPIDSMRDYFGEKIALYFDFLRFYTKQLWYMALLALIAQIMMSESSENAKNSMTVIFSIIIIMWSTFFIEFWKREQVLFSVQFGQQNFEEDEAERPAFEGQYVRSITNDDLNEEFYSPFKRKMKMLLSLAISFLIIAMVIACVIGIFLLKDYLNNCNCANDNRVFYDQVPAILNSIQIQIFNTIYSELGMRFNNFENHKILSSYENSLIAKIFIFMFVNTFNSFFIIAFMNSYFQSLNLCSINPNESNCFKTLQSQMTTIFLVTFIKNIPELAQPLIKSIIKKQQRQVDEKPVVHPFNKIDSFIEEQFLLEPYQTNEEVDGTVGDYMELVIQFSFLGLFGLAFPLSFLLAFITNVAEIQVDKMKLTKFSIRPFPQGASTIGNWLIILEVITFFGIFSNAGLIVYTSNSIKSDRIVTFSILLVVFLGIKYFIRFIIPDAPESAMILNKRHQYAVDRVVKGFAKSRAKSYKPARVNLNIGGVIYEEKLKEVSNQIDGMRGPNVVMQDQQ